MESDTSELQSIAPVPNLSRDARIHTVGGVVAVATAIASLGYGFVILVQKLLEQVN